MNDKDLATRRNDTARSYVKGKEKVECALCHKEIFKWNSLIKDRENNFCGEWCKAEFQKEQLKGAANPNWKGGLCEVKCAICGKIRKVKWFERHSAKYCSKACYVIGKKRSGTMPYLNYAKQIQIGKEGLGFEKVHKNCLHFGTGGQKHEMAKAVVCYILSEMGHAFYTEVPMFKGQIIDVFDYDTKVAYEVENNYCKKRIERKEEMKSWAVNDVIVIDIRKYKESDWEAMYADFKQRMRT